jgi:hypothetical protein
VVKTRTHHTFDDLFIETPLTEETQGLRSGQSTALFLSSFQQASSQCFFVNFTEGLANCALGHGLGNPFGLQFHPEPFPPYGMTSQPVLDPPLSVGLIVEVAKV